MPCDPNTLLEQAKCLHACIPPGMLPAVNTSLLCQIVDAGGGGGGLFVLKAGDTMTGGLTITPAAPLGTILFLNDPSIGAGFSSAQYDNGELVIKDSAGDVVFVASGITAPGQIGFFGVGQVGIRTSGANLTNNVTVGGVDNTIADFTSLTVYATDAAAIRNDIYQLARKLKQINDGLRAYGLFT